VLAVLVCAAFGLAYRVTGSPSRCRGIHVVIVEVVPKGILPEPWSTQDPEARPPFLFCLQPGVAAFYPGEPISTSGKLVIINDMTPQPDRRIPVTSHRIGFGGRIGGALPEQLKGLRLIGLPGHRMLAVLDGRWTLLAPGDVGVLEAEGSARVAVVRIVNLGSLQTRHNGLAQWQQEAYYSLWHDFRELALALR